MAPMVRLSTVLLAVNVMVPADVDKLKFNADVSARAPLFMVLTTAADPTTSTFLEPVTVRLVIVPVSQTVAVAVPFMMNLPVPKLIPRVLALLLLNCPVV